MSEKALSILFLCKGNSARSIMAEAILNRLGQHRIRAFSAGSTPSDSVHPHTIYVLGESGYDIEGLRPKSWEQFGHSEAQQMHLVVTLCDALAEEACPMWPGRPARAHWSVVDPVKESADHDDAREPFRAARIALEARIKAMLERFGQLSGSDRAGLERIAQFV